MIRLYADSSGSGEDDGRSPPAPNQLYMCLGARCEVVPETNASRVTPDDGFLLCSDGFWSQVSIEEVVGSLSGKDVGEGTVREWVHRAKLRADDGADNISLLLARLLPDARRHVTGRAGALLARFARLLPGRD